MVGRCGDELLGKAIEEACPLREFIKKLPERKSHAVNHKQADPRMSGQEIRQQVELSQQLHIVQTTHLREVTDGQSESVMTSL